MYEVDSVSYRERSTHEDIPLMIIKAESKGEWFSYSSDSDDDDDSNDSDKSDKSDDESSKGEYGFGCFTEDDEIDVDDEDDVEEIPPEDLYDALKPFYLGERFMIQEEAHCRDVYFKHPNHPGTEAFVRASQKVVLRQGVAKSYDEKTYKKMVRLLYDSKFFVGKAPECIEADEDECDRIFRARYEFDRKMMRKVLADNMESRPIPGTVCIKCSCCSKKDPNKDNCVIKLLLCVPKAMGIPVLAILGFFAFGFLYFFVYFVFKTLITAVYVATGVSLSFFFGDSGGDGGGDEEDTAVAEDVERYLRSRW